MFLKCALNIYLVKFNKMCDLYFEFFYWLVSYLYWMITKKLLYLFKVIGIDNNTVTKFVGRKEADRVGSWRLRYVYLRQINSHRCALCVTRKHQLSRSSPRSLSVFVPTVSLWQLVRSSLHSVSLPELPFHGGFYPVSTPITTIRHRWSSFCTWPTYLPLSPESFSRCRLRWTTPPSPQTRYSVIRYHKFYFWCIHIFYTVIMHVWLWFTECPCLLI